MADLSPQPEPEPNLTNAIKEKCTELGVLIDQL